jgi:hypothetical protein
VEAEIVSKSSAPKTLVKYVQVGESGYWELTIKSDTSVLDVLKAMTYIPTRAKLASAVTHDFVVHLNFK